MHAKRIAKLFYFISNTNRKVSHSWFLIVVKFSVDVSFIYIISGS